MIDYTIKEEYIENNWIFKGTIKFANPIPTSIIHTDDFAIRVVNPVTLYSKTIVDIPSSSDVEISSTEAMIKDLGYDASEEQTNAKIYANLIKNGGLTYFIDSNTIIVYLMPSYVFSSDTMVETSYPGYDMAQITVTFRLNDVLETINLQSGILPSIRRSNNYTIYKKEGTDSVFPDDKSRVINPEEPESSCSGYNFNETFVESGISTSANYNYNNTVDGLYIGPSASIYEASALIYMPLDNYNIEISSYLYDPYKDKKLSADCISGEWNFSSTEIFNIVPNELQAEDYLDLFSAISGGYSASYKVANVTQIVVPNPKESIQYQLRLECIVSAIDD